MKHLKELFKIMHTRDFDVSDASNIILKQHIYIKF